jgi:hypothetical protein
MPFCKANALFSPFFGLPEADKIHFHKRQNWIVVFETP